MMLSTEENHSPLEGECQRLDLLPLGFRPASLGCFTGNFATLFSRESLSARFAAPPPTRLATLRAESYGARVLVGLWCILRVTTKIKNSAEDAVCRLSWVFVLLEPLRHASNGNTAFRLSALIQSTESN